MKKIGMMAFAFSLILSAPVFADDMSSSVTVKGSGRVTVTPDLGTISFAVTEEGKKAEEDLKTIISRLPEYSCIPTMITPQTWKRSLDTGARFPCLSRR